jgi:hypothetical protein
MNVLSQNPWGARMSVMRAYRTTPGGGVYVACASGSSRRKWNSQLAPPRTDFKKHQLLGPSRTQLSVVIKAPQRQKKRKIDLNMAVRVQTDSIIRVSLQFPNRKSVVHISDEPDAAHNPVVALVDQRHVGCSPKPNVSRWTLFSMASHPLHIN